MRGNWSDLDISMNQNKSEYDLIKIRKRIEKDERDSKKMQIEWIWFVSGQ